MFFYYDTHRLQNFMFALAPPTRWGGLQRLPETRLVSPFYSQCLVQCLIIQWVLDNCLLFNHFLFYNLIKYAKLISNPLHMGFHSFWFPISFLYFVFLVFTLISISSHLIQEDFSNEFHSTLLLSFACFLLSNHIVVTSTAVTTTVILSTGKMSSFKIPLPCKQWVFRKGIPFLVLFWVSPTLLFPVCKHFPQIRNSSNSLTHDLRFHTVKHIFSLYITLEPQKCLVPKKKSHPTMF